MSDAATVLRESPVDFSTAVGYALHRTMRWLLALYLVGSMLLSYGLSLFFGNAFLAQIVGLGLALVGATLFFGGLVGAVFKIVVDGVTLADTVSEDA